MADEDRNKDDENEEEEEDAESEGNMGEFLEKDEGAGEEEDKQEERKDEDKEESEDDMDGFWGSFLIIFLESPSPAPISPISFHFFPFLSI